MSKRMRHGLALVVVALIAAVITALLAGQAEPPGSVIRGALGLLAVVWGLYGLVLIAVGLLRD